MLKVGLIQGEHFEPQQSQEWDGKENDDKKGNLLLPQLFTPHGEFGPAMERVNQRKSGLNIPSNKKYCADIGRYVPDVNYVFRERDIVKIENQRQVRRRGWYQT